MLGHAANTQAWTQLQRMRERMHRGASRQPKRAEHKRRSCHAPGFGAACSCAASAACSAHVPPRRSRAAARACATSSRRPGFRCPAAGAGSGRGGVSTSALHAPCGMATRTCMFPAASKQRRVQCQIVSGRRPHVPAPPVQWSAFCSCSAAAMGDLSTACPIHRYLKQPCGVPAY